MFNYQGRDTFKTVFGGLLSIAAFLGFFLCSMFKTNILINSGEWDLVSQNKVLNQKELTEEVSFKDYSNLTMGIQMRPSVS